MTRPKLNHFSPVFANQPWSHGGGCVCYYRDRHARRVLRVGKGRRQWGRMRRLYSTSVENALSEDLETPAALIYRSLFNGEALSTKERTKWAQFLRSQFVRTPSFMRYEMMARHATNTAEVPLEDRVGCEYCLDLQVVTMRDWTILVADKDEFFVRTDNPVHVTGFLTQPRTALYYPLTPRCCFVACSMPDSWEPFTDREVPRPSYSAFRLSKGAAFMLNFYFAKAADESVIVHPRNDGDSVATMLTEVLGVYPQAPFDIHLPSGDEIDDAYESLRLIMSVADGLVYPRYKATDVEPFFHPARGPGPTAP